MEKKMENEMETLGPLNAKAKAPASSSYVRASTSSAVPAGPMQMAWGRSQILSGTMQMEDLSRDAAYVRCAKNQTEPSDQLRDFLTWLGTYLQGQGDLVSRSTTQKIHIVTLTIPIINLLTKSVSPPDPPSKASRDASARGPQPGNWAQGAGFEGLGFRGRAFGLCY